MLPETTHMERMVLGAIRNVAPEVFERCLAIQGNGQGEKNIRKSLLLQELMVSRGPEILLELPDHVPENAMSSSLLYLLLNSSSPKELAEKFTRYDRFLHPAGRLELRESDADFLVIENVVYDHETSSAADELFFCGAVKYMLERIGCQGIKVEWLAASTEELAKVLVTMNISEPPVEKFTSWRFQWCEHRVRGYIRGLDEFLATYAEPFIMPRKMKVLDMVEKFMELDLGSKPGMEVIADMLGMSVRKFQRVLREEGTTYTRLYNELRIKVASRMLRQSDTNVTEIGFVCGFRDSAHFSREFKKVQQISPKRYRELFK